MMDAVPDAEGSDTPSEGQGAEAPAEPRTWVEVTFADPARATEWIGQHGVRAGHVQVLRAHRGQAALRLYLTERQTRSLPGRERAAAARPDPAAGAAND
jgi:hypothetical protein